jgi:hypothetical protein
MQSSGASISAVLLGQIPDSLVVIDLWAPHAAPVLDHNGTIVVKSTIVDVAYEDHVANFQPTATVLFLRNPVAIVASLTKKSYRDYGGKIEYKLRKYDRTFAARHNFDVVVRYEELTTDTARVVDRLRDAGIPVPVSAPNFDRAPTDIVAYARSLNDWCDRHYRTRWGLGGLHSEELSPLRPRAGARNSEALELSHAHCPLIVDYYAKLEG